MSKLSSRIERLEGNSAPARDWPEIIYLTAASHDGEQDEPGAALFVNCEVNGISREDGETGQQFEARAERTLAGNRRTPA